MALPTSPTSYGQWYQSTIFPLRVSNLKWYGTDLQSQIAYMAEQFYSLKSVQSYYPSFPGVKQCICLAKTIVEKESSFGPNKMNIYSGGSVSLVDSTDKVVRTNKHGLLNKSEIKFRNIASTTGISNYDKDYPTTNIYYVRNRDDYSFELAATPGGNKISLTTDGSATMLYTVYGLWQISNIHSFGMAQWPTKNGYDLNTMYNSEYNTRMAFTMMNSQINMQKNPWLAWSTYDAAKTACGF